MTAADGVWWTCLRATVRARAGAHGIESGGSKPGSAGSGVFLQRWGDESTNSGAVYGNAALIPLIGGSGGGEQPVVVRARNFGTQVPFSVVVAPDNGSTLEGSMVIDTRTANPATANVNVPVPANSPVKINVWPR